MSDDTQPDHLATVRAALDLAGKATPGPWAVGRDVNEGCLTLQANGVCAIIPFGRADADADAIVALRNAAPAIADLCREVEALRDAMRTISGIRDSIIGAQAVNWSEHVYPLVAALDGAGFAGASYETARANVGTLLQRIATLEAELAQARSHRCGGIVLSAEDADRIAALLEEQPGPTPAMLALFAKAKEE